MQCNEVFLRCIVIVFRVTELYWEITISGEPAICHSFHFHIICYVNILIAHNIGLICKPICHLRSLNSKIKASEKPRIYLNVHCPMSIDIRSSVTCVQILFLVKMSGFGLALHCTAVDG